MNINDILNKTRSGIVLTDEETIYFLDYYCTRIKKEYGIDNSKKSDYKVCFATTMDVGTEMILRSGLNGSLLNINKDLEIPLTHYSNVIVFNVNGKIVPYLIDLTYNQFFKEYNDDDNYVLLDDFVVSEKQRYLVNKLNKDGYVELNDELLRIYINLFLDFYKDKEVNRDNVYRNVVERIEKEALINISSIKHTREEILLLTRLRDDILAIAEEKTNESKKM